MGRAVDETCCGQEAGSAEKQVLARGLPMFTTGQAHGMGDSAEPCVQRVSGHCGKLSSPDSILTTRSLKFTGVFQRLGYMERS